jgi:hypothetical protein
LIQGGLQQSFFGNTSAIFDWLNSSIDYNTQYFFRVRALRDGQFSGFSSTASITTTLSPIASPPLITNVVVTGSTVTYTLVNTHTSAVTLFSDFNANPTTQRGIPPTPPNVAVQVSQSFTSSNTTIFARATSTTQANSPVVSEQFAAEFAPSAPSISAITSQVGRNLIDWTYSGEIVNGFIIERNPNFLNQNIFGVISDTVPPSSRTFVDTRNIDSQTTYQYRIRAFNQVGEATSTTSSVTTIEMRPSAPSGPVGTNLQTLSSDYGAITISFNRTSTNEDGFNIFFEDPTEVTGFNIIESVPTGQLSVVVTFPRSSGGGPSRPYNFRITAFNQFGESAPSGTVPIFI